MTPTLFLLGSLVAQASTSSEEMDLKQLAATADRVVSGEVLTQRVESTPSGVYTFVTILVDETLRGRAVPVVDIRIPGGKFGDIDVVVPGSPSFIEGTDVMLFLQGSHIVGMGDGAFILDGERIWRPLEGERFINPAGLSQELDSGLLDSHFQSWSMEEVRGALRVKR